MAVFLNLIVFFALKAEKVARSKIRIEIILPYIHNRRSNPHLLAVTFFAFTCLFPSQVFAQKHDMRGYKAVYNMKLLEAKPSSTVAAMSGQLDYGFKEDCDGWATSYQFDFKYNFTSQPPGQMTTQTTTYETKDFARYDFSIARQAGGVPLDSVKGYATLSDDQLVAHYKKPSVREEVYKGDILLPSEHAVKILEQARSGKAFTSYEVFDGLEQQGTRTVTTYVFAYKEDGAYHKKQDIPALGGKVKKWRVSIAYFSDSATQESSDYEMSATLYDNGVMGDIRLDYHDHIIGQELLELTMLDAPHCP
tara:strand:- start:119856 stop:120776 length:921 start_codon:yes stop_codon:yes gene_type:complete